MVCGHRRAVGILRRRQLRSQRGGMGKYVAALRQTSAQRRQQHREGEQRPLVGVDAAGGTEHGGLGLQPCRL